MDTFIIKAIKKHGQLYDYSSTHYKNSITKVIIICKKHGEFQQTPVEHLRGTGCPKCWRDRQKLSPSEFIARANMIHGDKYDYISEYKTIRTKIAIICQKHGIFYQSPLVHLNGSGCPKCYNDKLINSTEKFIKSAITTHGDTYDYTPTKFIKHNIPVDIICKIHGLFKQFPRNHLDGAGCRKCAKSICLLSKEQFIEKATTIHDDYYDYSKVKYIGAFSQIVIICPNHGEFKQLPSNHLQGAGCKECAINQRCLTTGEFIDRAKIKHNNKYLYTKTYYSKSHDKIIITCPKHGDFTQKANNHLNGQGCPHCATIVTSGQQEIKSLIPNDIVIIDNDKTIEPYEIDIFLPDYNIGVEYHGSYWHCQQVRINYDKYKCLNKHDIALKHGIALLQYYDFEVRNNKNIVQSMILHLLKRSKRIYARNCTIKRLSNKESNIFFDNNHLLGYRAAKYTYGLIYNEDIVAALSFSSHVKYHFEIIRFACKINHAVVGSFSKLITHFINDMKPTSIFTFADKRFGTGNVYSQYGFKLIGSTKPNYKYINLSNKEVLSRQRCQKHKLNELLGHTFDPLKSESDNMLSNGYGKLWDAGHYKFLLNLGIK